MNIDELIGRRSELLAELFLQDLSPKFVAKAPDDFGFDFIVGFGNSRGGVNVIAVEVKSGERVQRRLQMARKAYDLLANSNVPGLILVIDAKSNTILYHLLKPGRADPGKASVWVPLIEVDEGQRTFLRGLFASDEGAP